ncbi:MAG: GspH/FimT family pseudopilin [Burkholderiaceae bacterium]|jgi:type IV fimbrial biogenesis protein FimT|nr:GspH/FimT family pseudopilin [Burkholderiaceae bacterium]
MDFYSAGQQPPASPRPAHADPGFSALELIVVLAVLASLATFALPGFSLLLERWRVRQTAQSLQWSLLHARTEALKRGSMFIERLPHNAHGCRQAAAQRDWSCGWVVFADANGDRRWNAGEETQRTDTPPGVSVVRSSGGAVIRLDQWGMMDGLNAQGFRIAAPDAAGPARTVQAVCVASGGRIRTTDLGKSSCR